MSNVSTKALVGVANILRLFEKILGSGGDNSMDISNLINEIRTFLKENNLTLLEVVKEAQLPPLPTSLFTNANFAKLLSESI